MKLNVLCSKLNVKHCKILMLFGFREKAHQQAVFVYFSHACLLQLVLYLTGSGHKILSGNIKLTVRLRKLG